MNLKWERTEVYNWILIEDTGCLGSHLAYYENEFNQSKLVVFESCESSNKIFQDDLVNYCIDVSNPTENEILMLELKLGIPIKELFIKIKELNSGKEND